MSFFSKIISKFMKYKYKKLTSNILKISYSDNPSQEHTFFSQYGQDRYLLEEIYPNKTDGVFVDIGANDGVTYSNTYEMEKRGWSGLAIEPIDSTFKKLKAVRSCKCIHGGIYHTTGIQYFRSIVGYAEMLSGLVNEYDPKHLKRIEKEIAQYGGSYEDVEVQCYNLNELLNERNINYIDFMSIDVEGVEYTILQSIDFRKIKVASITIENNYQDLKIYRLLKKNGFRLHALIGGDELYINDLLICNV